MVREFYRIERPPSLSNSFIRLLDGIEPHASPNVLNRIRTPGFLISCITS